MADHRARAALRAVTRNMKAGYLRKNGVPYSEQATVTEQYTSSNIPMAMCG
jgi:hypothetical protein